MQQDFKILSVADGSWQSFRQAWADLCQQYDEEIDNFAPATMAELEKLAAEGHFRAGVYALPNGEGFDAVCQLNCVPLPGYDGPVLRVRFMTISPEFDLGDRTIIDYGRVLVALLFATIRVSDTGSMKARHVKLHLRSPADVQFFAAIGSGLADAGVFETVETHGSWLHISKKA